MQITVEPFTVRKRVPLTISRGTHAESTNLWLKVSAEHLEGWGEAVPFSIGTHHQTWNTVIADAHRLVELLKPYHPYDRQAISAAIDQVGLCSAVQAALDVALWDWLGKKTQEPLWRLWGLDRQAIQPTSVTIGIASPIAAQQRLADWLQQTNARAIKIKLGSPQGIEADQVMFQAIYDQTPGHVALSVDANGGWTLEQAIQMANWLAERQITHLEQPLAVTEHQHFQRLHQASPLPIMVDESCFTSHDIPALALYIDGINIKLMKAGGLTEALRMIYTARACGLKLMVGCYSDSSLPNTAMAHLSPLLDYIDLDSHLNLLDDPFQGATLLAGRLIPPDSPGLGVTRVG
jgi:L-alanine-DL-glutamate epimerase-like enolase superfamily enzyme